MASRYDAIPLVNKNRGVEDRKLRANYKIRDAAFSRQRYWGEPFPSSEKRNCLFDGRKGTATGIANSRVHKPDRW